MSKSDDRQMDSHWFRTFKIIYPRKFLFGSGFICEKTALRWGVAFSVDPEWKSVIFKVPMIRNQCPIDVLTIVLEV